MLVALDVEEWYPVYYVRKSEDYPEDNDTEVPDELVERFEKTLEEFQDVQEELRKIHKEKE